MAEHGLGRPLTDEEWAELTIQWEDNELRAGCRTEAADGTVFRLYRSSAAVRGTAIHVATFDTAHGAAYNRENCQIAARLFQNQPGVVVTYWCEPVLPSG
jgi:hypothetical protein